MHSTVGCNRAFYAELQWCIRTHKLNAIPLGVAMVHSHA